jgi:hypothetical protein
MQQAARDRHEWRSAEELTHPERSNRRPYELHFNRLMPQDVEQSSDPVVRRREMCQYSRAGTRRRPEQFFE